MAIVDSAGIFVQDRDLRALDGTEYIGVVKNNTTYKIKIVDFLAFFIDGFGVNLLADDGTTKLTSDDGTMLIGDI